MDYPIHDSLPLLGDHKFTFDAQGLLVLVQDPARLAEGARGVLVQVADGDARRQSGEVRVLPLVTKQKTEETKRPPKNPV